jgi:Ca-activated chloride channel family protein
MKDNAGNTVMSALNEDMCKKVAQAGSGTYIHVDNTSDAEEKLNAEITKLQTGETNSVVYSAYNEQFQAFCLILLLLLIIETCVMESKNPMMKKFKLFKKK